MEMDSWSEYLQFRSSRISVYEVFCVSFDGYGFFFYFLYRSAVGVAWQDRPQTKQAPLVFFFFLNLLKIFFCVAYVNRFWLASCIQGIYLLAKCNPSTWTYTQGSENGWHRSVCTLRLIRSHA